MVAWHDGAEPIRTFGHVFTGSEVLGMCRAAGLDVEQRFIVDYATGIQQQHASQGHLLYVLRHSTAAAADEVTCPQAALA